MPPILKRLTMLCAGTLLLACASPGGTPSATRQAFDAEQAYLIGRTHHMAMRPQQALAYYRSALRDDPAHLNARNGLAVRGREERTGQAAHLSSIT